MKGTRRGFEAFPWNPQQLARAQQLAKEGMKRRDIARELGTTLGSVTGKLRRLQAEEKKKT